MENKKESDIKDIVIIGAGGVGRETAWIIEQINLKKKEWNILGFIDDNKELQGKTLNGYKVLGGKEISRDFREDVFFSVAIADYNIKKQVVDYLGNRNKFATIIHPDIYIHKTNSIDDGSIIYQGVILTTNIEIGKHVIISPKCGIGHDSKLKDYVTLLWNVNISGNDVIEEGCLIGSGATILQNLIMGEKSIIGAGAVVVNNVKSNSTVVGVPAKYIKSYLAQ